MAVAGQLEILLLANVARLQSDMTQAKGAVGSAMKSIESSVAMAKSALGALGISLGVGYFVSLTKGAIDAADKFNDLTQSMGVNRTELAKYQLATAQSGTTLDGLAKGVKGVATAFAEHGDELRAAGITAKDTDGKMRQIADVFANMPDGIEKTTLAVKLFGKSGMELIPMLNMGSAGLAETAEKSAKYAAVLATLAPQADKFNDTMAELGMVSKVASLSILNDLLPSFTRLTEEMLKSQAAGEGFFTSIARGLAAAVRVPEVQQVALKISELGDEAAELQKKISSPYMNAISPGTVASDEAKLGKVNEQIAMMRARYELLNHDISEASKPKTFNESEWIEKYKKMLAALGVEGKKANNDAERELKRLREADLKGYLTGLEAEITETEEFYKTTAALKEENSKHNAKLRDEDLKGWVAMADAIVNANFDEAQQLAKDQIDAAKQIEDAKKKIDDERLREQKRVADETDRMIGDAIMRGFERGEDAAKNFRDTLVNMFKTLVLRPVISAVMSPVTGAVGAALGGMSGTANAAGNGLSLLSSASNSGLFSMGLTGMADYAAGFATTATASQAAAAAMVESGTVGFAGAGMEAGAAGAMGFSAAIPYVGAAVLAMYALGVFDSDEREKVLIGTGVTGRITRGGLQGSLASNWGTGPNDRWGGTTLSELPAAALTAINNTINNVFANMTDAAKKMGLSVADLSDIVVDFTTSSQNGDQTANDLNAALAATSDAIALKLIPNIRSLQYQGESLTQTFARLSAAQAALDAQKRTMEIALMEAQGKSVEALAAKRELELGALDQTLHALQQRIYAEQDLAKALDTAKSSAKDATDKQLEAARGSADLWRGISKSITDTLHQLTDGPLSPLTSGQRYSSARMAMMGGGSLADLPQLVTEFLKVSRERNSSSQAYQNDYDLAISMLEEAKTTSASAVSDQEVLITKLSDLATAIEDAVANDASVAVLNEISGKLSGGASGDAGGLLKELLYQNYLGRQDLAFKDLTDRWHAGEFASLGDFDAATVKWRTENPIPNHAMGLDYVPYDGYTAKLHSGEAVLTSAQASGWRSGSQGITSEDLRALRADVQRLTAIVAAGDQANVQATERVAQVQETAAWRDEVRPVVK